MMDTISSVGAGVGHGSIGRRGREDGPKAARYGRSPRCTGPWGTAPSRRAVAAQATLAAEADILHLLATAPEL
jgi:hypothetical protein